MALAPTPAPKGLLRRLAAFACWIAISFVAAYVGSRFEPGAWYDTIRKPAFTPPSSVFPIVWPILYGLMGIAAGAVWQRRHGRDVRAPLALFLLQLALNAVWSWLFFGRHEIGLALAEILVLWAAILATLLAFHRVRPLAGWLLLPYLAWVTFATLLNYSIWRLNT